MTLLETADMLADVLGIENVYAGCIDANQDKLDISSVIDGINADNSTYLNTSKVVIDGTSQTINAKFTELTASMAVSVPVLPRWKATCRAFVQRCRKHTLRNRRSIIYR